MKCQYVLIDLIGIPVDPGPEPVDDVQLDPTQISPDGLITENINQSSDLNIGSFNSQSQSNIPDCTRPSDSLPPSLDFKSHSTAKSPSDSPVFKPPEQPSGIEDPLVSLERHSTINRPYESPFATLSESPAIPTSDKIIRSCLKKSKRKVNKDKESKSPPGSEDPSDFPGSHSTINRLTVRKDVQPTELSVDPKSERVLRSCLKKPVKKGNNKNANVTFTSHNRIKYYRPSSKLTSSKSCVYETEVKMKEEFLGWKYQLVPDYDLMLALDIEPGEILDYRTDVHPRRLIEMLSAMAARTENMRRKLGHPEDIDYEVSVPSPKLTVATSSIDKVPSLDDHIKNIPLANVMQEMAACNLKASDSDITNKSCLCDKQPSKLKSHLQKCTSLEVSDKKCLALSTENVTREENQPMNQSSVLSEAESAKHASFLGLDSKKSEKLDTLSTGTSVSYVHVDGRNPRPCADDNPKGRKDGYENSGFQILTATSPDHPLNTGVVDVRPPQYLSNSKGNCTVTRPDSPSENTKGEEVVPSRSLDHQESGKSLDKERLRKDKDNSVTLLQSHLGKTAKETGLNGALPILPAQPSPDVIPLDQRGSHKHCSEKESTTPSSESETIKEDKAIVANEPPHISTSISSRSCISFLEMTCLKESLPVFPTGSTDSHLRPTRPGYRANNRQFSKSNVSVNQDHCQESEKQKLPIQRTTSDVSGRPKCRENRPKRGNSLPPQSQDHRDTNILVNKTEIHIYSNDENDTTTSSSKSGNPSEDKVSVTNAPLLVTTRLKESLPAVPKSQHGKTKDRGKTTISSASTNSGPCQESEKRKLLELQTTRDVSKTSGKRRRDRRVSAINGPRSKTGGKEYEDEQLSAIHGDMAKASRKERGVESQDVQLCAIYGHRNATSEKEKEETKNGNLSVLNGQRAKKSGKERRNESKDEQLSVKNGHRAKTMGKRREEAKDDTSNAVNGQRAMKNGKEGRAETNDEQISVVNGQRARSNKKQRKRETTDDSSGDRAKTSGKQGREKTKDGSITGKVVKKAWKQTISGRSEDEITATEACSSFTIQAGTITREAVRNRFRAREYSISCEKDDVKTVRRVARALNSGKDPCKRGEKKKGKSQYERGIQSSGASVPSVDKPGPQTSQKEKPGKIRRFLMTFCDKVMRIGKRQHKQYSCQTAKPTSVDILQLPATPSRSCLKKQTEGGGIIKAKLNVKFAVENTIRCYNTSRKVPSTKSFLDECVVKMKETCGGGQVRRVAKRHTSVWRGKKQCGT